MGMARIVTPKGDEPSGNPPRRNRLQRTSQHTRCRDPRLPIPQDPSSSSLVIRTRQPNGQTLRTANLVSLHKMMNPEPLDTIRQTAWWSLSGSNRRPSACKADALPAELRPRLSRQTDTRTMKPKLNQSQRLVGPGRFELPTSPLSGVRSNQLSYGPVPMNLHDPGPGRGRQTTLAPICTKAVHHPVEERETWAAAPAKPRRS